MYPFNCFLNRTPETLILANFLVYIDGFLIFRPAITLPWGLRYSELKQKILLSIVWSVCQTDIKYLVSPALYKYIFTTSSQKLSKQDPRCFLSKFINQRPPLLLLEYSTVKDINGTADVNLSNLPSDTTILFNLKLCSTGDDIVRLLSSEINLVNYLPWLSLWTQNSQVTFIKPLLNKINFWMKKYTSSLLYQNDFKKSLMYNSTCQYKRLNYNLQ